MLRRVSNIGKQITYEQTNIGLEHLGKHFFGKSPHKPKSMNRSTKTKSKAKASTKAKHHKRKSTKPRRAPRPAPRPRLRALPPKQLSRPAPRVGFLGARPSAASVRGNKLTTTGLTMRGGTVSGVTEISANIQILSGQNVAGQIIALIPLHPQLIAPGTRLADIAAMYDQYVFSKVQFELDPTLPFAVGGRLLGFVERDATDPIGAAGTAVGNVAEWMDHGSAIDHPVQGGSGQSRLIFPRRSRYMYQIGKGPVGGYYLNKLAVNGSTTSTDINNCYQGQFCLMIHTPLNTEGGQALSFPIPLGPLRVRWTLKFREAAERSQGQSGADKHYSNEGSPSTQTNPYGWSTTLTKQSTLLSWSTLGLQTRITTGSTTVIRGVTSTQVSMTGAFPIGFYAVFMTVDWSASGASSVSFRSSANPTSIWAAQTGVTWLDYDETYPQLSSGGLQSMSCMLQFEVTVPGELVLAYVTGSTTGWILDGYASMHIVTLPASATSLLKHPNLTLRGLAFQDHVAKQGSGRALAAQIRQELGLPQKEEKDSRLELAWKRILQDEQQLERKNAAAHLPRPGADQWDALDQDEPDSERRPERKSAPTHRKTAGPWDRADHDDDDWDVPHAPSDEKDPASTTSRSRPSSIKGTSR